MVYSFFLCSNEIYVIIRTRDDIRLITARIIVNTVQTSSVTGKWVVGRWRGDVPNLDHDSYWESLYFDGTVQGGGSKWIWIFGVELDTHDEIIVSLVRLRMSTMERGTYTNTVKVVFPIPELDHHIIRASDDVRLCLMHIQSTNEILMGDKLCDLEWIHRLLLGRRNILGRECCNCTHGSSYHRIQ